MKPAEMIREEKKILVREIRTAITRFSERTGYYLNSIEIPFIETTGYGDEAKETTVGRIDVTVVL